MGGAPWGGCRTCTTTAAGGGRSALRAWFLLFGLRSCLGGVVCVGRLDASVAAGARDLPELRWKIWDSGDD